MIETLLSFWFIAFIAIAGVELFRGGVSHRKLASDRWPTNAALIVMSAGLAAAIPISSTTVAIWVGDHGYGLLNFVAMPVWLDVLLGFLFLSLRDYFVHLICHKVPFLWRFHRVHHSDYKLDVTTTFRVHPVMHLLLIVLNGVPVFLIGISPEAVIIHLLVVLCFDMSHHTTLLIPEWLDRRLRPFIITPRLHHFHHSSFQPETDSNYGHDLALWDRIFGTYLTHSKHPEKTFTFGLEEFLPARANDLDAVLKSPFQHSHNRISTSDTIHDE